MEWTGILRNNEILRKLLPEIFKIMSSIIHMEHLKFPQPKGFDFLTLNYFEVEMGRTHNVDVSCSDLHVRLPLIRQSRGMSRQDLADKARLCERTIRQIETGRRSALQEKTLLLIADALGLELSDLVQVPGSRDDEIAASPRSTDAREPILTGKLARFRFLAGIGAVIVFTVVVLGLAAFRRDDNMEILRRGDAVVGVETEHGKALWTRNFQAKIEFLEASPWGDQGALVGLGFDAPDGGRILLLDRRTGQMIWELGPDPGKVAAAYGEGILDGLHLFGPIVHQFLDFDGDGQREIAIAFIHMRNYPCVVMIARRDGTLLGEYINPGHVYSMKAADLDQDGRDELVCAGASNVPGFSGGTVFLLDAEHCDGATTVSLDDPTLVQDQGLARIFIPGFDREIMDFLDVTRLDTDSISIASSVDGNCRIVVRTGTMQLGLHLFLDEDLKPLAVRPSDNVARCVREWPVDNPDSFGPASADWLNQWFSGILWVSNLGSPTS